MDYEGNFQYINFSRPFKFLIHGWHDGFEGDLNTQPLNVDRRLRHELWMEPLGQEWVRRTNSNVCIINWSYLAKGCYFSTVTIQIPRVVRDAVGKIGVFIEHGMNISEVSIAGHSLGAHIAGSIGRNLNEFYETKINAIYGVFACLLLK